MSTYDVLRTRGAAALACFAGLIVLFLALHALKAPFELASRGLDAAMRGVDRVVTTRVSTPENSEHRPGRQQSRQERTYRAGFSSTHDNARTGGQSW